MCAIGLCKMQGFKNRAKKLPYIENYEEIHLIQLYYNTNLLLKYKNSS